MSVKKKIGKTTASVVPRNERDVRIDGVLLKMIIQPIGGGVRLVYFEQDGKCIPVPKTVSCTMFMNKMPLLHPTVTSTTSEISECYRVGHGFEFYFFDGDDEFCSIRGRSGTRIKFKK